MQFVHRKEGREGTALGLGWGFELFGFNGATFYLAVHVTAQQYRVFMYLPSCSEAQRFVQVDFKEHWSSVWETGTEEGAGTRAMI